MTNGEKLEQIFPDGICPFSHNWLESEYKPSIQPKTDVLDKIRAEIEFIPTIEWKDDGTTYILASYFKKQVLEIIDKYKAESEG